MAMKFSAFSTAPELKPYHQMVLGHIQDISSIRLLDGTLTGTITQIEPDNDGK